MSNHTHITQADIEHRFGFHKATVEGPEATLPKHRDVRILYMDFVAELIKIIGTHPSRESALVMTHLQEAAMWTHCAIAMEAPLVDERPEAGKG